MEIDRISWKNTMISSIGGVGIQFSPRSSHTLINVDKINTRMIVDNSQETL